MSNSAFKKQSPITKSKKKHDPTDEKRSVEEDTTTRKITRESLNKTEEYIKMIGEINYNLLIPTINQNLKDQANNQQNSSINNLSNHINQTQNSNVFQLKDEKNKGKGNNPGKNVLNEVEKDKSFFKYLPLKNDSENKKINLLSDYIDKSVPFEKAINILSHKLISDKVEVINMKNNSSNIEQIHFNLYLSLSRESFDLADNFNNNAYSKHIRSKIFNSLGIDQDSMSFNQKLNNTILSYIISNALSLKEAYNSDEKLKNQDYEYQQVFTENLDDEEEIQIYSNDVVLFEEDFETIDNKLVFDQRRKNIREPPSFKICNEISLTINRYLGFKNNLKKIVEKDVNILVDFMNSIKYPIIPIEDNNTESQYDDADDTHSINTESKQSLNKNDVVEDLYNSDNMEVQVTHNFNIRNSNNENIEREDEIYVETNPVYTPQNIIKYSNDKERLVSRSNSRFNYAQSPEDSIQNMKDSFEKKKSNPFLNSLHNHNIKETKFKVTYMNAGYGILKKSTNIKSTYKEIQKKQDKQKKQEHSVLQQKVKAKKDNNIEELKKLLKVNIIKNHKKQSSSSSWNEV